MSAAALVLVAGQILGAAQLRELGAADDARAIPHLDNSLESSIEEYASFPPGLAPTDLEDEISAALLSLERLEQERALTWARTIVASSRGWVRTLAHRVIARSGDRSVVSTALDEYFGAPSVWRDVLADAAVATRDARLRDFAGLAGARDAPRPPTPALLRSRVAYAFGETIDRPSVRSFASLLDHDTLEIHRAVLALVPPERYRAMRWLAMRDHAALVGLPMTSDTIDRLYPYFARSSHRQLRERLHRARSARGPALASLLVSPRTDRKERQIHAGAMRDAWFDAMVAVGRDLLTPIVGETTMLREIEHGVASAGAVHIELPEARALLERAATPEAIRWLGSRSDVVASLPSFVALRDSSVADVRLAAEIELVRLAAPGATAWLRSERSDEHLRALLPAAVESPADEDAVRELIERIGGREGHQPEALVAMSRFHRRYPREFLAWLDSPKPRLRERAHFVMALSGERRRLPLLIELAVAGRGVSRDAGLRGLAEADLGHFDQRLHRLAGDPDRAIRFQVALALVPSGQEWALPLLVAELVVADASERLRARRAVERLPRDQALSLLETLVSNGTATPFAVELYLSLAQARDTSQWHAPLWRMLAPYVDDEDPTALLAAARLSHPEARAAVVRYLGGR